MLKSQENGRVSRFWRRAEGKEKADEIEALRSIYGDQWQNEDELAGAYRVEVTEGRCEAALHIKLPPLYPCSAPPQYQLSAPTLTRSEKESLS
ncbi:hypothetical protein J6590_086185 [Homalodisca vitripennis]|nr:hypothetical protein J6590_086185 [Homalodisca vitripennis]